MDRDPAGNTGPAVAAMWTITVGSAATKAVLDQLVVDRHVEPQFRVGYQVATHPVIKITAG